MLEHTSSCKKMTERQKSEKLKKVVAVSEEKIQERSEGGTDFPAVI